MRNTAALDEEFLAPSSLIHTTPKMLTESFVASVLTPEGSFNSSITKDAGIHTYESQPQPALKSSFKKSSTRANCLAVSESHVFAAQADKAVVHVYSRERGNQETLVPFPEKICSLALVGSPKGAGILALGTEGGRIILWEVGIFHILVKGIADPTK